jgi:hypothetical protein
VRSVVAHPAKPNPAPNPAMVNAVSVRIAIVLNPLSFVAVQ